MGTKRAVTPMIATVILVAVAITVSVAVSYWLGGYYVPTEIVPTEGTYQIGDQITEAYFYKGVVDDAIVVGTSQTSYFLPVRYDQEYHVGRIHIRIIEFDPETFELTIAWTHEGATIT